MRQKTSVVVILILIVFLSMHSIISYDRVHAKEIVLTAYVYDLSGGCADEGYPCKDEKIVTDTYDHYYRLLKNAGLEDRVKLVVKNLRRANVLKELEEHPDDNVRDYINKPYTLMFVNGVFEVNMEKSPQTFYTILKKYMPRQLHVKIDQAKRNLHDSNKDIVEDKIIYFYRIDCPYCVKIEDQIDSLRDGRLLEYDLADEANIELYRKYLQIYGYGDPDIQPSTMVPAIFVNDVYLRGSGRIIDYFPLLQDHVNYRTITVPDVIVSND